MFSYVIFGLLVAALIVPFTSQGRALLLPGGAPPRVVTAGAALLLAVTGVLVAREFIYDRGDNAYLLIWMLGGGLVLAGAPFVTATLLPHGRARVLIAQLAVGLTLCFALLGLMALAWSAVMFPGDDVRDEVAEAHLYAGLCLVGATAAVLFGCRLLARAEAGR